MKVDINIELSVSGAKAFYSDTNGNNIRVFNIIQHPCLNGRVLASTTPDGPQTLDLSADKVTIEVDLHCPELVTLSETRLFSLKELLQSGW